ncbi:Lipoyltransferase and lipoate-protein ligase [Daedalea quercina L-15889]|uniref:Putative lipoate-protein ligase A n=1 Tax=Daedalea quercina L-15889 TaxID=1314783 RepID=A0A165MRT4_9APHY|nr:Lipoyltransferase and lipoate-protein ligase [Daedalea quercina L-15889]
MHHLPTYRQSKSCLPVIAARTTVGARSSRLRSSCSRTLAADSSLSPQHSVYVSRSTNPYFNLTLEDWLFRHKRPKEPLLLLYRDDPCVVIGRNQNPWKEVNLEASRRTGVPWIRRRSGGGTVYHDWGNTNFSIHLPRTSFDRHATAQVVLRAVRSLGIDARVNDRNDICVGEYKISGPGSRGFLAAGYVSGSAYKIVNNRAYHHGTMLISTKLGLLGDLLHVSKNTIQTKGVESVRSPVRNLQQFNPAVSHETFVNAVVAAFRTEYGIDEEIRIVQEDANVKDIEYIRNGMAELPSWDWAFGQTPEFSQKVTTKFSWGELTAEIRSKHGVILSCCFEMSNRRDLELEQQLAALGEKLKQQKYGLVDESALGPEVHGGATGEVWGWLRVEMSN